MGLYKADLGRQIEDGPAYRRPHAFRKELGGLVALPCFSSDSAAGIGRRIAADLRAEQEKLAPDTHLIATLCDAARLIDELLEAVDQWQANCAAEADCGGRKAMRAGTAGRPGR